MVFFVAYMGGIVEEERLFFLGWCGDEIGRKDAVRPLQIEEVDRLLLDDLVVHEGNGHNADIAISETLDVWRETSQVVTGALGEGKKENRKVNRYWTNNPAFNK